METTKFKVRHSAESDKHVGIWYVADVKSEDINAAVYEAFKVVAQKVLDCSDSNLDTGDYTAAELAGTFGTIVPAVNCESELIAPEQCIKVGGFSCHFSASDVFQYMAEWEGVAGIKSKDIHKFHWESRGKGFGRPQWSRTELKPYKRHLCYKPTTISLTDENKAIARKFETLGKLYNSLTGEGMRRAVSMLAAIHMWDNCGWELRLMADNAIRQKFWKDYGKKGCEPIAFCKDDFKYGPEIWKHVDAKYKGELMTYFQTMMSSAKQEKPSWPVEGDMVQFKDKDSLPKKYQGKYLVEKVAMRLNASRDAIEWVATLRTKKYECESFYPSRLEPAPVKLKKKGKAKTEKKASAPKAAPATEKKPEQTLSDRLRDALRRQLGIAA